MIDSRRVALLVGRGLMNSSRLVETFHAHQWECLFAASYGEAHSHLNSSRFGLLLSELYLPDGSASRLIPWLEGSQTTMFFSLSTSVVTWWLPAVDHGKACFGAAALRAVEFGRRLEESLQEMLGPTERDSFAAVQPIDSVRVPIRFPLDCPGRTRSRGKQELVLNIQRQAG
jgi:hypothetical protein